MLVAHQAAITRRVSTPCCISTSIIIRLIQRSSFTSERKQTSTKYTVVTITNQDGRLTWPFPLHTPSTCSLCCATTVLDPICDAVSTTTHYPVATPCRLVCYALSLSLQVDAYTLPSERGKYHLSEFTLCQIPPMFSVQTDQTTCARLTRSLSFYRAGPCRQG